MLNEKLSWHYYINDLNAIPSDYIQNNILVTNISDELAIRHGIFKIIKVCPNNITINQVSRTIAYTKNYPVCSQNKRTNSRAEVLSTTQAFEKTIHEKLRRQQSDVKKIFYRTANSPRQALSFSKKKKANSHTKEKKNLKHFFLLWSEG